MPHSIIKSASQKNAEADVDGFRKDLGPFVVAAETTRMAMVFMDAKETGNPIIFANDAFLELTGYDREEVLGQDFNFLMARGADPDALARIKAAFAGTAKGGSEIFYRRKDRSEFWSAILISPVEDENGDLVQYFDPKVIRESIESRLFALSRSHDLLTRENWESAGLLDLIKAALEPFGVANGRAERFVLAGRNTRVPPKIALALGIALHELATNAVKYGAFSNKARCRSHGRSSRQRTASASSCAGKRRTARR
jgi:PAS domain S-box-containing protein